MSGLSFSIVPNTSIFSAIAQAESGGNPTAVNPNSTASGLYQIVNGTWKQYAPVDVFAQYPTAGSAPADVQTSVAGNIPLSQWASFAPATAQAVANAGYDVASNINKTLNEIDANSGGSSAGADIAGSVAEGDNPYSTVPSGSAAGAPGAGAIPGTTSNTVGTWYEAVIDWISNEFNRFILVLIAAVIILGAIFLMAREQRIV